MGGIENSNSYFKIAITINSLQKLNYFSSQKTKLLNSVAYFASNETIVFLPQKQTIVFNSF